MRVGSLVELVDDLNMVAPYGDEILPVKSKVYEVRSIDDYWEALTLEEIVNPVKQYSQGEREIMFKIIRFAELLPPMTISIEEIQHELV